MNQNKSTKIFNGITHVGTSFMLAIIRIEFGGEATWGIDRVQATQPTFKIIFSELLSLFNFKYFNVFCTFVNTLIKIYNFWGPL